MFDYRQDFQLQTFWHNYTCTRSLHILDVAQAALHGGVHPTIVTKSVRLLAGFIYRRAPPPLSCMHLRRPIVTQPIRPSTHLNVLSLARAVERFHLP